MALYRTCRFDGADRETVSKTLLTLYEAFNTFLERIWSGAGPHARRGKADGEARVEGGLQRVEQVLLAVLRVLHHLRARAEGRGSAANTPVAMVPRFGAAFLSHSGSTYLPP